MTNRSLHSSPYVSNSFLNQFVELVLSRRGNLVELCKLADLPKEVFTEENRLIPFDRFIRLLEITERELDFPEVALALAQRQDITILGPLSIMLYDCKTIEEALNVIFQYLQLIVSGIEIQTTESEHLVEINFNCYLPDLYQRPQFQNYLLASTTKVVRELIGRKYALRGCFIAYPEPSEAQVKNFMHFFECPVAFGTDQLRLTLTSPFMQEPYEATEEAITKRINTLVESQGNIVNQVSKVIALSLPSGKADMKMVARSMGYSARTLHRHLSASSTSFKALLDSVRLTHADQYLKSTHYSLTDIAALLGYKSLSAFTRSYRRWCGVSPSSVRKSLLETK
ncbi:AraC family transcriptional regulator [Maricurvus nonylphenolicus]|uniref:AraC family transcriptional regulator n=1 Tax=Maricurvus nonylphenolicus TaxID=1008307 RepID=UPI0036F3126E